MSTSPPLLGAGSSPRVRGKLIFAVICLIAAGLIPACAGKTPYRTTAGYSRRAHPRVCGENPRPRRGALQDSGSSPRVRGKPAGLSRGHCWSGLIPACAGKTKTHRGTRSTTWAHPRVCGENMISCVLWLVAPGSSPRVRGKRESVYRVTASSGLIPACAGKTRGAGGPPLP